jgi:hypothetical protein
MYTHGTISTNYAMVSNMTLRRDDTTNARDDEVTE